MRDRAATAVGRGTGSRADPGSSRVLRGRVVDDKGLGVDGAEVIACRGIVRDPVMVNRESPACASELARGLSTPAGAFTLSWVGGKSVAPGSTIVLVVHRVGFFSAQDLRCLVRP